MQKQKRTKKTQTLHTNCPWPKTEQIAQTTAVQSQNRLKNVHKKKDFCETPGGSNFRFSILKILDLGSLCSSSLCDALNGFPILVFQFWALGFWILDPYVAVLYVRVVPDQIQKRAPTPKWIQKTIVRGSFLHLVLASGGLVFGFGFWARFWTWFWCPGIHFWI